MFESIALTALGAGLVVAILLGLALASKILEIRDSHRAIYTFSRSFGGSGISPDLREHDVRIKRVRGTFIIEFVEYSDEDKPQVVSTVTLKKVDVPRDS